MKRFKVWYSTNKGGGKFLETYAKDEIQATERVLTANKNVSDFEIMNIEQVTKIKGG